MMVLPAMANGVAATAKPATISSQAAEVAGTTQAASFTDPADQTRSQLDKGQAQLESTQNGQENQASNESVANELSTDAARLPGAEPDVPSAVIDDPLTADSLPPLLTTEQETAESSESGALTDLDEALAEPATQLWHWHYSRSARVDQATAQHSATEQAASEQATAKHITAEKMALMPTAAESDLAAAQARADQGSGQQTLAARVASNESAAERRFSLSNAFAEQGSTSASPLAGNKLLLQQLASGAMAPAKVEEISTSLANSGLALSAAPGRASVPVHEWAPVVVDSTNKAQLGAQLLQTLKDKVELQLNQEVQQARIKLDPPEMGRLELSIRLEGDKLHIHINASHSGVRDALNAHADRLRNDLLAQHTGGVEVSVGQGNASSQGEQHSEASRQSEQLISSAERAAAELEQQGIALRGWINTLV